MLGKTPDILVQREPSAALALIPCLAGHAFSSKRGVKRLATGILALKCLTSHTCLVKTGKLPSR